MPRLRVIEGPLKGQAFDLLEEVVFIGRSAKNDIQIKDGAISRKQLKIFKIGRNFFVEDLKSTNGTRINGKPASPGEGFEVADGDLVSIGSTVMRLEGLSGGPIAPPRWKEPEAPAKDRRTQHAKDLELTFKVTELLRQPFDLRQICRESLAFLLEAFPRVDRAVVVLLQQGREIREVIAKAREGHEDTAAQFGRKIAEKVIREGKAVRMSNTSYEGPEQLSETMHRLEIKSVLCVPMISRSQVMGAIYMDSVRAPYGFRKADLLLLNSLSGPIAVAVENAALASKLKP